MSSYAYSPTRSSKYRHSETTSSSFQQFSNQDRIQELEEYGTQEFTSDALDWTSLLLFDGAKLSSNSLNDIAPTNNLSGMVRMASAMVDGAQSFRESPAQSTTARSLDALMDVSGSLMMSANPLVGAVDMFLPETVKMSNLVDGSSSAISSLVEGMITEDSTAMESFMKNAKGGDYSWLMKEAVEAGEFWAR